MSLVALAAAARALAAASPPSVPNLGKLLGRPDRVAYVNESGYRWECAFWFYRQGVDRFCVPVAKLKTAKPAARKKAAGPSA